MAAGCSLDERRMSENERKRAKQQPRRGSVKMAGDDAHGYICRRCCWTADGLWRACPTCVTPTLRA